MKARESTDEDRDRPGLNTSGTTWTTVSTGTDCRWQMMMTTTAQLARISYLSQDRPDLKFASMQVCCAMARPTMRDMERVRRIGRFLVGRPRARCWFRWQQCDELGSVFGRRLVRRQGHREVRVGWVIMRGVHCLKVWTKKQQVVSLSSAESELYVAVTTASERLGIQSITKDMGRSCGLNLHWDAPATMCLVNRRGLGKAKHVDMQNLWIQEASKAGRFVTKKVGTNVNPADLMTKPLAKPKIEQLMSIMGFDFLGNDVDSLDCRSTGGYEGTFVTCGRRRWRSGD